MSEMTQISKKRKSDEEVIFEMRTNMDSELMKSEMT